VRTNSFILPGIQMYGFNKSSYWEQIKNVFLSFMYLKYVSAIAKLYVGITSFRKISGLRPWKITKVEKKSIFVCTPSSLGYSFPVVS
jgi:hypothetical protein